MAIGLRGHQELYLLKYIHAIPLLPQQVEDAVRGDVGASGCHRGESPQPETPKCRVEFLLRRCGFPLPPLFFLLCPALIFVLLRPAQLFPFLC